MLTTNLLFKIMQRLQIVFLQFIFSFENIFILIPFGFEPTHTLLVFKTRHMTYNETHQAINLFVVYHLIIIITE